MLQVWKTRPVFPDRAGLDAYELALQHAGRLDQALEVTFRCAPQIAIYMLRGTQAASSVAQKRMLSHVGGGVGN